MSSPLRTYGGKLAMGVLIQGAAKKLTLVSFSARNPPVYESFIYASCLNLIIAINIAAFSLFSATLKIYYEAVTRFSKNWNDIGKL